MASTANKMQVRSVRSVPFVPTKRDPSAHGPASNAEKWNTPGNFFMAVNFAAFMTEVERLRAIDNIDCTRVSVGEEGSDDYVSVEWRFALMVPGTSVAFFVTKSRYAVRYIAPLSRAAVRTAIHGAEPHGSAAAADPTTVTIMESMPPELAAARPRAVEAAAPGKGAVTRRTD